jgi:hypothetical protein
MVVLPAMKAARMSRGSIESAVANLSDQAVDGFQHQAAEFFLALIGLRA